MCYPGVCEADSSKTLEVFVKRIQASSNGSNLPNVCFLQGGPGYSSVSMEELMVSLHTLLRGAVNVYTMDHRGTGRSSFLDCVASQATTLGSPHGTDFDLSEVPGCAQELEIKYGSDLSMFSITSAANDMSSFISTFLAGSTTFVYGVSYSTAVVERLIHLAPKEVVGYILDGVSTASGSDLSNFEYFSTWDQQFNEVGNAYMDLCTQDPACSKYFGSSDLSTVARNLVLSFDKVPNSRCAALLGDREPGRVLRKWLAALLEGLKSRENIPMLVYHLSKCDEQDATSVSLLLSDKAKQSLAMSATSESEYYLPLLYYLIMFSEMWQVPGVSWSTMLEQFTNSTIANGIMDYTYLYCAFTRENSTTCAAVVSWTDYQPIVYKRDKYWNKAAEIPDQASVLIMNSKLDPQTPYKYTKFLLDALIGENKHLVTFDYAPHASYVFNHGNISMTNMSCVEDHNALGLNVSWDKVFAVDTNSTRRSSSSSSGVISNLAVVSSGSSSSSANDANLVAMIVSLLAPILVLFIFIAFVVDYCRSKPAKHKPIIG